MNQLRTVEVVVSGPMRLDLPDHVDTAAAVPDPTDLAAYRAVRNEL